MTSSYSDFRKTVFGDNQNDTEPYAGQSYDEFKAKHLTTDAQPKPAGLGARIVNTGQALGRMAYDMPGNIAGYAGSLAEGSHPLDENNWADTAVKGANQRLNERMTAPDANDPTLLGTKGDWAQTGSSVPFSVGSMGAAIGAGALTGAVTKNPQAAFGAGAVAAGALAHRADSAMFMRNALDGYTKKYQQDNNGAMPSQESLLAEQERLQPYANEHGLWEAVPEGVGSAIGGKLVGGVFKQGGNLLAKGAKAIAGIGAEELPTETITQHGQNNTEIDAGVHGGEKRSWTNLNDLGQSLGEVAMPVLQQSLLMGGGAAAIKKAYDYASSGPLSRAASQAPAATLALPAPSATGVGTTASEEGLNTADYTSADFGKTDEEQGVKDGIINSGNNTGTGSPVFTGPEQTSGQPDSVDNPQGGVDELFRRVDEGGGDGRAYLAGRTEDGTPNNTKQSGSNGEGSDSHDAFKAGSTADNSPPTTASQELSPEQQTEQAKQAQQDNDVTTTQPDTGLEPRADTAGVAASPTPGAADNRSAAEHNHVATVPTGSNAEFSPTHKLNDGYDTPVVKTEDGYKDAEGFHYGHDEEATPIKQELRGDTNKKPTSEIAKTNNSEVGRVDANYTSNKIAIRNSLVDADKAGKTILDEYGIKATSTPDKEGTVKLTFPDGLSSAGLASLTRALKVSGNDVIATSKNGVSEIYARPRQDNQLTQAQHDQASPSKAKAPEEKGVTQGAVKNAQGVDTFSESAAKAILSSKAKQYADITPKTHELREVGKGKFQVVPKAEVTGVTDKIVGDKINNKWTSFHKKSGSIGIPRAEMPQVKAEHRGALVNFLNAKDISHEQVDIPAKDLKPTQAEFSPEKVEKAKKYEGGDRSILISSDNHVVDGHHQWLAKLHNGEDIKAIRLNAPIKSLINQVKEFPSAETAAGSTKPNEQTPKTSPSLVDGQPDKSRNEAETGSGAERSSLPNTKVEEEVKLGNYKVTTKKGVYSIKIQRNGVGDEYNISATVDGKFAGDLNIGKNREDKSAWSASNLFINSEFRRQGIATALYDAAVNSGMSKIIPDYRKLSDDGKKLWESQPSKEWVVKNEVTQENIHPAEAKPQDEQADKGVKLADKAEIIEHTTAKGKVLRGIVRTDLTKAEAQEIDKYTFKKDGGWFIREKNLTGELPAQKEVSERPATQAKPAVAEKSKQDAQAKAAAKLRQVAQATLDKATAEQNRDRNTHTPRMARMASGSLEQARKEEALAKTMMNIADAIESGEVYRLSGIKSKTQVELLNKLINQSMYAHDKARNISYAEQERQKGRPATLDDIKFIQYPELKLTSTSVAQVKARLGEIRGGKKIAETIYGEYLTRDKYDQISKLVGSEDKLKDILGWYPVDQAKEQTRLKLMGITNQTELQGAANEFLQFKEGAKKADPIKAAEMALVGQKLGIDFFPTPKSLAERMAKLAGIKPGMRVLEPSAGNGNLADAAKASGGNVDAIEISHALRNVLDAKGYNVVAHDFSNYHPDEKYDAVIMNPPFSNSQDAEHIQRAYDMLNPGGKLVAIAGEGVFFRNDKKATAFREWLDENNAEVEKLPANTFQDKTLLNTTGANARLIVIDKPESGDTRYSKSVPETFKDVEAKLDALGIKNYISEGRSGITVSNITVPKESRNKGIGTQAMQLLADYADQTQQRIVLTPSSDFGGNKARLVKFYQRFGFVLNSGKNKDYSVSESMYRDPVQSKYSKSTPVTGSTVADIKKLLPARVNKLVAAGKLEVVQSADDLPEHLNALYHRAFHGSPHDHNKFDSSKIGTGEGNSVFGYGHYFTDEKDVAEWYRKGLSALLVDGRPATTDQANAFSVLVDNNNDINAAVKDGRNETDRATGNVKAKLQSRQDVLESWANNLPDLESSGKLYEVELAPTQDEYLDWNKPISDQSEKVKRSLNALHSSVRKIIMPERSSGGELRGQDIYYNLRDYFSEGRRNDAFSNMANFGSKEASQELLDLGIRGIRYKADDGKSNSNNYVIFDDNDISIAAKYSKLDGVEALYDGKRDKLYLVADMLNNDNLPSVLAHELLHRGEAQDPKLKAAIDRFESDLSRRFDLASRGVGTKAELNAYKRVMDANTPEQHQAEEWRAYMVSEWMRSPDSFTSKVKQVFADFIASIRAFLIRNGADLGFIKSLTPADLAALSKYGAAVHRQGVDNKILSQLASVYKWEGTAHEYDQQFYEGVFSENGKKPGVRAENKYADDKANQENKAKPDENSGVRYSQAPDESTPAFKRWFGDSKMKRGGKPIKFYHGSNSDFTVFDKSKLATSTQHSTAGLGHFFSENKEESSRYGGNVHEAYLRIENPYIVNSWQLDKEFDNAEGAAKFAKQLKAKGYDGVYIKDAKYAVIFDSNQAKLTNNKTPSFADDIRYSKSMGDIADKATDFINNHLDTSKTFNLWHKTVGTQAHKATVDKNFKPVFDNSMAYEEDIARLANEAADAAPSWFPKLDGMVDAVKEFPNGLKRIKDAKKVGEAIFQTTINDKRMTDAELSAEGYTDKQRTMYHEFFAAVNKSMDDLAKSEMLREAKALKMTPADEKLSVKDTANFYAEQTQDPNEAKSFIDKAQQIEKLQRQGYAPLMRFGRYTVDVVKQNAKGEENRVFFGMFETESEANQMRKVMETEYPDATVKQGIMSQNDWQMFKGVTPESMEVFAKMMNVDQDKAFQQYLAQAVNNRSAMKRLIHRKKMPGFANDPQRVLASFITGNAKMASKNIHLGDMVKAIADIPKEKGDVKDEAVELYNYVQNPSEKGAAIRGMLFAWYLGGSAASAMVNLSQTLTTTTPYLHQYGTTKQVAAIMGQAMKLAARNHNLITGDLGAALKRADEEGVTAPHELHMLYGDSMRTSTISSLYLRPLTKVWGSLFSLAESYNRRVAFIAAYKLAQQNSNADPFAFAAQAVKDTQFIYSKSSRPNWGRSTVGSMIMTFKTFSISYMEFLKRLPPKERTIALGILIMLAGLSGLPGADDADDVIDTLGQSLGYNTNSKEWKDKVLSSMIGKTAADYMLYGASTGLPVDIGGRLGVGNLIPGSSLLKKSETNKSRDVMEFAGAAGSLAAKAVDAWDAASSRDDLTSKAQAIGKAVIPKAFSDAWQAADMIKTGQYRDARGRNVVETDTTDAILKGLGLQPTSVSEPRRVQRFVNQDVTMTKAVKADIAELWAQGMYEKDRSKVDEAKAMMADWNEKNPDTPIKVNMKQIIQRTKQMKLTSAQRMIKTTPKEMRGYAREMLD